MAAGASFRSEFSSENIKMWHKLGFTALVLLIGGVIAVVAVEPAERTRSGQVIDFATKKPMANVYVLAEYSRGGSTPFGHSARWCFKTRGLRTGPDGTFSFPLEKDTSMRILATAPDSVDVFSPRIQSVSTWLGEKRVDSPNVFMAKRGTGQDERLDIISCGRPESIAAATANIEFLELILVETRKYESSGEATAIKNMIVLLKSERR